MPRRSQRVPTPPGGHALRIDVHAARRRRQLALPVVGEISAGGIVVNTKVSHLPTAIIARRNRGGRLEWCLPKGHLENEETPAEAAIREVAEETGIDATIMQPLGVIDYWFTGDDRRVHKIVHHFLLAAVGGELSVEGDPDQEAEEAAWVPLLDLPTRLAYPNERRLTKAAASVLTGER